MGLVKAQRNLNQQSSLSSLNQKQKVTSLHIRDKFCSLLTSGLILMASPTLSLDKQISVTSQADQEGRPEQMKLILNWIFFYSFQYFIYVVVLMLAASRC